MSRRESLEGLKAHSQNIDRALSHGEWWLNHERGESHLAVTRIGDGALTNSQKTERDAFVAKRMLSRRNRRY